MGIFSTPFRRLAAALGLAAALQLPAHAAPQSLDATVNGVKLHYLRAGSGPAVILVHGYTQTSHMWLPLIPKLAATHTVIAPDLRGAGGSERPAGGYDKKTLAQDVHALAQSLGIKRAKIVGHDIGLMVAYAYAAQYPDEVDSVVLLDAFLPGVGDWKSVWLLRDLWHFHFYGEVPLKLVHGRERIYFEHFWNDFAADRTHSVPDADRQFYAREYAKADGMRAGFEYFKAFEQDAKDNEAFAKTKLQMPMLVLTGEKASGNFLIDQARLVDANVDGVVIKGSGHWLMEEAPGETMQRLVDFLGADAEERLTPVEIDARVKAAPGAGSSGVAGIQTVVLKGDPTQPGLYTIQLRVPPNTTIQAHRHPDDRVVTVVAGTWNFGYGARFDEKALEALPPGSFYTEPPDQPHFARTGSERAIVNITGVGPTGTQYEDPANDPAHKK